MIKKMSFSKEVERDKDSPEDGVIKISIKKGKLIFRQDVQWSEDVGLDKMIKRTAEITCVNVAAVDGPTSFFSKTERSTKLLRWHFFDREDPRTFPPEYCICRVMVAQNGRYHPDVGESILECEGKYCTFGCEDRFSSDDVVAWAKLPLDRISALEIKKLRKEWRASH